MRTPKSFVTLLMSMLVLGTCMLGAAYADDSSDAGYVEETAPTGSGTDDSNTSEGEVSETRTSSELEADSTQESTDAGSSSGLGNEEIGSDSFGTDIPQDSWQDFSFEDPNDSVDIPTDQFFDVSQEFGQELAAMDFDTFSNLWDSTLVSQMSFVLDNEAFSADAFDRFSNQWDAEHGSMAIENVTADPGYSEQEFQDFSSDFESQVEVISQQDLSTPTTVVSADVAWDVPVSSDLLATR